MPEQISDLSYRTYTGSHLAARARWLVIAKMGWRTAFRKRAFWVFTTLASWYYLVLLAFLYVLEQLGMAQKAPQLTGQIFARMTWKDQFLTGFTYAQLIWLALGLLVGIGAISNDNGTNALLVYLSKPCRKIDYLVGKWMGVFVPLLVGMGVPTLFFYLYGLMNYRDYGFLTQDPWLGYKLLVVLVGSAVFQTSVLVGVSSLFNKGRMAGAAFSSGYFLMTFFSFLMFVAWAVGTGGPRHRNARPELAALAEKLYHTSFDGLQIGFAKNVLGTGGSAPFAASGNMPQMHSPPFGLVLVPMVLLSLIGIWVAWSRIRAVEVVK